VYTVRGRLEAVYRYCALSRAGETGDDRGQPCRRRGARQGSLRRLCGPKMFAGHSQEGVDGQPGTLMAHTAN